MMSLRELQALENLEGERDALAEQVEDLKHDLAAAEETIYGLKPDETAKNSEPRIDTNPHESVDAVDKSGCLSYDSSEAFMCENGSIIAIRDITDPDTGNVRSFFIWRGKYSPPHVIGHAFSSFNEGPIMTHKMALKMLHEGASMYNLKPVSVKENDTCSCNCTPWPPCKPDSAWLPNSMLQGSATVLPLLPMVPQMSRRDVFVLGGMIGFLSGDIEGELSTHEIAARAVEVADLTLKAADADDQAKGVEL